MLRRATSGATGIARWLLTVVLGSVLVVLGIVMLFTPGPGVAMLILGVYVWAWQFAWARRLLDALIRRVEERRERLPAFVGRLLDRRNERAQIRRALEEAAQREATNADPHLEPGQSSGRT